MVKFDSRQTLSAGQHKKICNGINVAYLSALFFFATVLAACSKYAERNWGLYLGGICLFGVLLVIYFISLFLITLPAGRRLKRCVCKELADELLAEEEFLQGGGKIEFYVEYSGNVLTLSRKNYTGKITLSPERTESGAPLKSEGAKRQLDLTNLKPVPSVYATVGSLLLRFLSAYYSLHGESGGISAVTVTDCTGKKPYSLNVFGEGAPTAAKKSNCFLKDNLIK